MKRCICILCHNESDIILRIVERLYEQTQNTGIDIWILFDESHGQYSSKLSHKYNTVSFTYQNLSNIYHIYEPYKDEDPETNLKYNYVGNTIFPLLYFYSQHKYDYYMFYESDALYTGNISDLYNSIVKEKHDAYFFDEFLTIDNDRLWNWWDINSSYIKYPDDVQESHFKHNVMNMYVLSSKGINIINDEYMSGMWYGHHEWVLPTILSYRNADIQIIRDKINDCVQEWNTNTFEIYMDEHKDEIKQNSIYHPIKRLYWLRIILSYLKM